MSGEGRTHAVIRWIQVGITGGLCASVLYPALLFAPLPLHATAALAAMLGPPANAGLVDIGPLVGLWFLAATVQAWRSLGWARLRVAT
jgi:hypothetical protein